MKLSKISHAVRTQTSINSKAMFFGTALFTALTTAAYAAEAEVEVQQQDKTASTIEVKNKDGQIEVIEVRGMRGTMTRSLNEKKNNPAIVDSIAAADFGDLPGLSLSDVIENVSGASGHRLKGSQNEISIRGLGSYWGYSTFNGRTITNAGPGRAVNFKKFPSSLVDKVTIYKSQQANLVEGGTSGTIDVNSLRAVDYGKSETTIEAQAAYNDYYTQADNQSPWGNEFKLSTVQNFETDALGDMGFSFGYVQSNSANPEENYGTSSTLAACSFRAADGSPLITTDGGTTLDPQERCGDRDMSNGVPENDTMVSPGRSNDLVTLGPNANPDHFGENGADHLAKFDPDSIFFIPDDSYWRTGHDEDERRNIVGTFQWVPNDKWDINIDYASSRLEYTEQRMELAQERAKNLNPETLIIDSRGNLLYEEGEGKLTLQGENRNQIDEYDGYGINVEFFANDNLSFAVDASYSKSYRYRLRQRAKFRHESTTAYSLDSRGDVPKLYIGDNEAIENANFYYQNVGGELVRNEAYQGAAFDVSDMASFVGSDGGAYLEYGRENDEREDDVWALEFSSQYEFDDYEVVSSIEVGVRHSREHLYDYSEIQTAFNVDDGSRRPLDDNWNSDDHVDRDGANNDFDSLYPEEHAEVTARAMTCGDNGHSLEGFHSAAGGAGDASNFLTFDSKCVIGAYLGQVGFLTEEGNNPDVGFYDIGEDPDKRSGQLKDVREEVTAIYAMANIDTELFDLPVTGNIGVRYVETKTNSKSWGERAILTQTFAEDDPATEDIDEEGQEIWEYSEETARLSLKDEYTEVLPSMNLTFHLTDEWLLRTAAYRSMSRFPMNAMSAGQTLTDCDSAAASEENECGAYDDALAEGSAQGNMMKPYTADNYDLSLEWYPSLDMAITLAGYWKNFNGGTTRVTEYRVPTVTTILADGTTSVGPYSQAIPYSANQVSDEDSTIKGFELTFQKHFTELPGVLSGLGVQGAWNHAISDFNSEEPANWGISPDANLFGFSKNVASGSIYWEGDDLTMRLMYKYRSRYFQPNNLPFPHKGNRWVEDSDYLDAAIKYKINSNFSVSLKALNLLEEAQVQTRGPGTISDYSYSGRKLFLGVKAKF
ncbi:TonB-dependent receptor [Thalassotalea sp. PLHSN55]|uniref:TonB-dependent receptor n=1 Tax=Thalassotalea sp. PLHSN55 TaxID=3435888 RepID=UPI003F86A150